MKVPPGALEKLVLAGEAEFGPAVLSAQALVSSTEGYTNNSYYTAVGKTIPRKLVDGAVTSTIICRQELIQAVFIGIESKKPIDEWQPVPQQGWYVLHHEVGHALDHHQRCDAHVSSEKFTSLRQIGGHYTDMLLSEFAASFHSGHAMAPAVYADEIRSTTETLTEMFVEIEEKKCQHAAGSSSLFSLAATVSQTMWLTLVQYAKIFGSRAVNDSLKSQPLVYWVDANPETIAALESYGEALESIRVHYPNWTDDTIGQLIDHWEDLCDANGYAFEFSPTGSEEFYFNPIP
jgi:hypothetical protein